MQQGSVTQARFTTLLATRYQAAPPLSPFAPRPAPFFLSWERRPELAERELEPDVEAAQTLQAARGHATAAA